MSDVFRNHPALRSRADFPDRGAGAALQPIPGDGYGPRLSVGAGGRAARDGKRGRSNRRVGCAVLLLIAGCGERGEANVEPQDQRPPDAAYGEVAPRKIEVPLAGPAPEGASDATSSPPLTAEGWGDLRIGMTRAEVVAAAGEDANPDAVGGPDPEMCDLFRPVEAPEGMLVMIERDTLTRISISSPADIETDRGISVGDPAEAVKAILGSQAVVSPHKYLASPAEYIALWTAAGAGAESRGVVHEVGADGRVIHIHAGGPSIQYVEGCL